MWRILVVEDDVDTQQLIARALGAACVLRMADRLETALRELSTERFDLILLDVALPDGEGFQLCAAAQAESRTAGIPVIFLTARDQSEARVKAFRLGADDFVAKPFEAAELRARVENKLLKARRRQELEEIVERGALRIHLGLLRASKLEPDGERDLDLTLHEFRLLHHLASHEERVFSRAQLLEAVWPNTVVLERTVDTHVSNLRRKLGSEGGRICAVRGVGYRFASDPRAA